MGGSSVERAPSRCFSPWEVEAIAETSGGSEKTWVPSSLVSSIRGSQRRFGLFGPEPMKARRLVHVIDRDWYS